MRNVWPILVLLCHRLMSGCHWLSQCFRQPRLSIGNWHSQWHPTLVFRPVAAFSILLILSLTTIRALAADPVARPNIVWIVVDDMSANFGCYGETAIKTPHVDQLAQQGIQFTQAFTTAPVCSPCRSALITGCFQTAIGAHHHRSGRGVEKIKLPAGVLPVPALFQQAGYYTCIGGPLVAGTKALGKADYNFEWDEKIYNGNDWSGRAPDQPFFMQVQLHGGKYRGATRKQYDNWAARVKKELGELTPQEGLQLPPYYPNDPALLEDWALYLDTVRYTDKEVGDVVARLKEEGLLDKTVIFFITDHGISHARGKQFLYEEGLHIPFIVRGPGISADIVRADLVQQIDLAPTSLALAGIEIPPTMQGKNILAKDYKPRTVIAAARDRCDETVDHLRCVRTERYKYIRNYLPERPYLQPNRYKDDKLIVQRLRELHAAKQLNPLQAELLFAPKRPPEELYDLTVDPHETQNLIADPAHAMALGALRAQLAAWELDTKDLGRQPETSAMYDSDMAVYLGRPKGKNGNGIKDAATLVLERNIKQMKQWAQEGK